MGQASSRHGKRGAFGVALLLALAAGAWMARGPLLSWFYVHQLAAADDSDREVWVERVVGLEEAALPALLKCLDRDDARACANIEAALSALARRWAPDGPRAAALNQRLLAAFPGLSAPGQEAVLECQIALVPADSKVRLPQAFAQTARELFLLAAQRPEPGTRERTLALGDVLVDRLEAGPWLAAYRELIRKGLADGLAEMRVRAVHVTLHPRFRADTDLLQRIVPLLRDPAPAVRRAAVLAVGPVKDLLSEEDLLPMLHDPDADVRRLCETALRGRGLQDCQIKLGRLMSDTRASERLQVVYHLRDDPEQVEPGVWLRRLSHDPSPAVRAAAVRATAAETLVDLSDRLREMAQSDPSPSVRQLAVHYLRWDPWGLGAVKRH